MKQVFIQTTDYFIPTHDVTDKSVPSERSMNLPLVYVLDGCDADGFVYGKGKCAIKMQQ